MLLRCKNGEVAGLSDEEVMNHFGSNAAVQRERRRRKRSGQPSFDHRGGNRYGERIIQGMRALTDSES